MVNFLNNGGLELMFGIGVFVYVSVGEWIRSRKRTCVLSTIKN